MYPLNGDNKKFGKEPTKNPAPARTNAVFTVQWFVWSFKSVKKSIVYEEPKETTVYTTILLFCYKSGFFVSILSLQGDSRHNNIHSFFYAKKGDHPKYSK